MAAGSRTEYRISELDGSTAAIHVRWDAPGQPKRFVWEQPDGTLGLGGRSVASLPLYGLARLQSGATDAPVFVVEGEKAADALAKVGIVALGTVTGAAATPDGSVLSALAGRDVRLWPDNDVPGRAHMATIASSLEAVATSIGVVQWPSAPEGGDAADFVASGATQDEVLGLRIVSADLLIEAAAESNLTRSINSAGRSITGGAESKLVFQTAREFASATPADVPWIAKPYVAAGAITGVDGKIKAAGKTTFVTSLCRAVLDGLPFLGFPTHQTGVVYLTEQPPSSFRETLRRADLLGRADLTLLTWRHTAGIAWPDVVDAAVVECQHRSAGLLVVDTLSRFAGIHGDGENNAGEAEAAMAPLQLAAADGLGVVVVRHERKAGGDVGDSGRGSTAFGGAVDIVMAIRRRGGNTAPNSRVIQSLSRFDETPDSLVVELTDSGYHVLGDSAAADRIDSQADVVRWVTERPGSTIDDLVATGGRGRTRLQGELEQLETDGRLRRTGQGKRGDPYRYHPTTVVTGHIDTSAASRSDAELLAELLRHAGGDMESLGEFHD